MKKSFILFLLAAFAVMSVGTAAFAANAKLAQNAPIRRKPWPPPLSRRGTAD